jgi:tRNA dimethylallyltransferase
MEKIIVILGPTGSGKSSLAIKLAKDFSGEIVSADSRQIYNNFIIGSGLVNGEIKKNVFVSEDISHHIVQFLEPEKDFSVSEFKKLATQRIKEIHTKNNLPFLVGGTGLYIDSIVKNLILAGPKPNQALRKKLETKSLDELNNQLKILDPLSSKTIDIKNKRRVIRAIEVCLSGVLFSSQNNQGPELFDTLKIGIKVNRPELYKNIDKRVDGMISDGLITEVEDLLKLHPKISPAFSGIGYKQVIEFLGGKYSEVEMIQKIKNATHAYARRQITWFKRNSEINWVSNYKESNELVKEFLNEK